MQQTLRQLYQQLLKHYGKQYWWPAKSPFEVMVGAILTQNTSWRNVEMAIVNLKQARCLSPQKICQLNVEELAQLIKSSGFHTVKAKRLQAYCAWYVAQGGLKKLKRFKTQRLRAELLKIHGIGPETADAMLLYAFLRPVFVIDAYTKRILQRLGWIQGMEDYETLRALFEQNLKPDVNVFNEYHALLVQHAKHVCRTKPLCQQCHLYAKLCPAVSGN